MSQRPFIMVRCEKHQSGYAIDAETKVGMCPDCRRELPYEIAPEYGWVVQAVGADSGVMFYFDGATWQNDHMKALRFAREIDAMQAIDRMTFGEGNAVHHMWLGRILHEVG